MTIPITKEQLQRIIESADDVLSALAGTNDDIHPDNNKKMCGLWDDLNDRYAPPEVVRELARIALAAMDAEPVADVVAWHKEGEERTCDIRWRRFDVAPGPLFAVAQPVAVVPDEMAISDDMNLYQKSFAQGHNACRAAMLNHSEHERDMVEPVSQPYKLREGVAALRNSGIEIDAVKVLAERDTGNSPVTPEGWQLVPVEPTKEMIDAGWLHFMGTKNPSSKGTYKAMLAAAPQQEVK